MPIETPGGVEDAFELEMARRVVARLNECVAIDRQSLQQMLDQRAHVYGAGLASHSHFVIDGKTREFGPLGLLNGLVRLTPPLAIRAIYVERRLVGFDLGHATHGEYVKEA
jgi:hypothetical protein